MEYNEKRILTIGNKSYYLNQWEEGVTEPCSKCQLQDLCDRISDDLNRIEVEFCLEVEDKEYALKYNSTTYFKEI